MARHAGRARRGGGARMTAARAALRRLTGDAAARARGWIARGLGVPDEGSTFDWLVRAFFHAPAPGARDVARDWLR
ncbi:hypothetical protein, partial [Burkholderia thailandensis]|uniref:hypothetical protein n=1 Tax=Burkholderia thailandensis TaxID=57975 RepID=UPI003F902353